MDFGYNHKNSNVIESKKYGDEFRNYAERVKVSSALNMPMTVLLQSLTPNAA